MTTETYNYDDFTSGSDAIATTGVTIASGQNLAALVPIGQITATGLFVECDTAATDGSQTPVYITAQAIDATSADTATQVYKAGTFDPDMLTFHASFTAAQKLTAFVGTPISLQAQNAKLS